MNKKPFDPIDLALAIIIGVLVGAVAMELAWKLITGSW